MTGISLRPNESVTDAVFAYSEWLDGQGLMLVPEGDKRTHDDLVKEWQASR